MTALNTSTNLVINPEDMVLWDFAGVDGQQVARRLFGEIASQIAPFQSASVHLHDRSSPEATGSLLRLCEANYRVALPPDVDLIPLIDVQTHQVWGKRSSPCETAQSSCTQTHAPHQMAILVVPDDWGRLHMPQIATTKPLYSLHELPLNRAAPARIQDKAALIWRHVWNGSPRFQIQTAIKDKEAIATLLGDRLG